MTEDHEDSPVEAATVTAVAPDAAEVSDSPADRGTGSPAPDGQPEPASDGQPEGDEAGSETQVAQHEHLFDGAGVPLVAQLQALLFISEDALTEERLAAAVGRTVADVRVTLGQLQQRLAAPESGIVLREHASGWRLTTASDVAPMLERFVVDGHSARLSAAALETLAVIAYQQPVSRSRIAAIRGVAVDGVVRTLLSRGLIEEAGTEASGAIVYETTPLFLDKLGVKSLLELPELAPLLPDIETLDALSDQSFVRLTPAVDAGHLGSPGGEAASAGTGSGVAHDSDGFAGDDHSDSSAGRVESDAPDSGLSAGDSVLASSVELPGDDTGLSAAAVGPTVSPDGSGAGAQWAGSSEVPDALTGGAAAEGRSAVDGHRDQAADGVADAHAEVRDGNDGERDRNV